MLNICFFWQQSATKIYRSCCWWYGCGVYGFYGCYGIGGTGGNEGIGGIGGVGGNWYDGGNGYDGDKDIIIIN